MKLASKLPEGDHDGTRKLEQDMLRDPKRPRPVIVVLNASRIIENADSGSREATARILHVEQFHPDDLPEVERLIRRGREYTTGQPTLPLEIEDELDKVLQGVLSGEPYEYGSNPAPAVDADSDDRQDGDGDPDEEEEPSDETPGSGQPPDDEEERDAEGYPVFDDGNGDGDDKQET